MTKEVIPCCFTTEALIGSVFWVISQLLLTILLNFASYLRNRI